MKVHPTATVEPGSEIGEGTHVWHYCHVRRGARIGAECVLGKGVFVDSGAVIADRVKIQNHVSVFNGVTIETGVFVGPHVCFTNDKIPRAVNPDLSAKGVSDWKVTPTVVREGASIGANATVVAGVTLGKWCMIGAGAVVTRDIPAYALAVGNPARIVAYVDETGKIVRSSKS